ncbi:MAG: hypothetical protein GY803_21965 [Chloroflexi bacterium]|nr:hypothetical protein [Chloroflexota bacterium]
MKQAQVELTDEQKRMIVDCSGPECGKEFKMDETAVHKRPVAGEEWIDEYGLVCPHCGYWQHIMLDCAKLKRFRNSKEMKLHAYKQARTDRAARAYRRADRRLKAEFNRFHAEWRPKLGLVPPSSLLKPDDIGAPDEEE